MSSGAPKYGITNIDYVHELIHRGLYFAVSHLFKAVSDEAYVYIRIKTGAVEIHPFITVNSEGKAYVSMYREAAVADGTVLLITHFNDEKDRRSLIDSIFYHTPTVDSSPGTIWFPERLLVGGTGPKSNGGEVQAREELYLEKNHEYLLAVQNQGGAAKDININIGFYPHDIT